MRAHLKSCDYAVAMIAIGLLHTPVAALADTGAPPLSETVVWHVVRTGDTLEGLAARFLGDAGRWTEDYKLNPQVKDPHKLTPGERLQIKVAQRPDHPAALLRRTSRVVNDKLGPTDWAAAHANDLMLDRDGLRTGQKSSAEMQFNDGTRLLVTEDSLIFLREKDQALQPVANRSIEIQKGTADLDATTSPSPAADIEIVMGGTRATAKAKGNNTSQSRARKLADGGAQLMVYGGAASVEAAGAKVEVPRGSGTAVPASGPPGAPEVLLPAPTLASPAPGAISSCAAQTVRWNAVPGASSYTAEICRDDSCALLVDRRTGLRDPQWETAPLAEGNYFVRVAAVAASGLDGYSSAARTFTVRLQGGANAPIDPAAAAKMLAIHSTAFAAESAGTLWLDGKGQLAGAPSDPSLRWTPLLDGKPATAADWRGPWPAGAHLASAVVKDACGGEIILPPVRFQVDKDPPTFTWKLVDLPVSQAQKDDETTQRQRFPRPWRWPLPAQLEWSLDKNSWIPMDWGVETPWRRGPQVPPANWFSTLDDPEGLAGRLAAPASEASIFLRAPKSNPFVGDAPVRLAGWQALEIKVKDAGSGVARLQVKTVQLSSGKWVLRILAADLVGNRTILDWPLVAHSGK